MRNEFLTKIFDFFLPRICPACNQKLKHSEEIICDNCFDKLKLAHESLIEEEYHKKFSAKKYISDFHPVFIFEKDREVQHIIHALKYNRHFSVGIYFGKIIGNQIKDKLDNWKIDLIIPVPLHKLKKAERGYNQSEFIAKGISVQTGIRWNKKIISRKKYTETQTHLTAEERQLNVKDAFKIKDKDAVDGKNILLVDDVITTGSTISECAHQLILAGAKNIYATSMAIAE
ncbi:ComF family protein [Ignavibacterium sp.]|uniref:ComF family protein n=1 Tax=Ignavibacterium sp. TaxID=2651167 RepID=UPI002208A1AA|nr:ComF family protein [Ignavibacterium sp.]BDQ02695.1 MAG: amidophosphoribosyltransferase [Ignavibacterium sp.]